VQIFIKMHRSDYAERQLRIMQQIDEDHTLTQLANAWLDLAVVISYINKLILLLLSLSTFLLMFWLVILECGLLLQWKVYF
jgi:coatomer protein complex subunit epsilon